MRNRSRVRDLGFVIAKVKRNFQTGAQLAIAQNVVRFDFLCLQSIQTKLAELVSSHFADEGYRHSEFGQSTCQNRRSTSQAQHHLLGSNLAPQNWKGLQSDSNNVNVQFSYDQHFFLSFQ